MYAWIITRDKWQEKCLREYGEDNQSDVGTIGPRNASGKHLALVQNGKGLKFRMRCDDETI
jgi:hypothetical protein